MGKDNYNKDEWVEAMQEQRKKDYEKGLRDELNDDSSFNPDKCDGFIEPDIPTPSVDAEPVAWRLQSGSKHFWVHNNNELERLRNSGWKVAEKLYPAQALSDKDAEIDELKQLLVNDKALDRSDKESDSLRNLIICSLNGLHWRTKEIERLKEALMKLRSVKPFSYANKMRNKIIDQAIGESDGKQ